jgi:hypothetical protein
MEKKKVFKVFVTFSQEASIKLDTGNPLDVIEDEKLQRGYDWEIKQFDSRPEAEAYIEGVLDANGWSDPNAIML